MNRHFFSAPSNRYNASYRGRPVRIDMPTTRDLNNPVWAGWAEINEDLAQWIVRKLDAPNFDFGRKMFDAVLRYGDLTDGQVNAIARMIERDRQWSANQAAGRPQTVVSIDCSKIRDAFVRGQAAGISHLKLRFRGFVVSPAGMNGRNPGALYVKKPEGLYLGKIVGNEFFPSRDCSPETRAEFVLVASDPAAAARVYGLETGNCCICGRHLTNAESVTAGIGPICAGRVGFTPGGLVRRAGEDF